MPLYMDVHRNLNGVTPDDLAQAHYKDVEVQEKHGVCYHKYWLNQETGTVFCLVEGPNKEACDEVHRRAHGLVADAMIEVEPTLVEAFMGSELPNGAGAAVVNDGKLDVGSRIVLFTEVADFAAAVNRLGDEAALGVLRSHDAIVAEKLPRHGGRQIKNTGEGIMAGFTSASSALRFAAEIQEYCSTQRASITGYYPQLRIGMAAGEPVEQNDSLFGISVLAARRICDAAEPGEVLVSAGVHELAVGKGFSFADRGSVKLKDLEEPLGLFSLKLMQEPQTVAEPIALAQPVQRTSSQSRLRRFGRELRRRHVHTVGVVYAGVLFILLQVAQLTFEPLGLPDWAYTLVLVLGIFGFPLAIVLAWGFDVTDQGVQRTAPDTQPTHSDALHR